MSDRKTGAVGYMTDMQMEAGSRGEQWRTDDPRLLGRRCEILVLVPDRRGHVPAIGRVETKHGWSVLLDYALEVKDMRSLVAEDEEWPGFRWFCIPPTAP